MKQLKPILERAFEENLPLALSTTDFKSLDFWDSLKHMQLIVDLETQFNLSLSSDEILSIKSVQDIERLLASKGITASA
jgi:acyl carrier protein